MNPEERHPVEPAARDLGFALFGIADDAERTRLMRVHLQFIFDELLVRGVDEDVAAQHMGKIVARAEQIEAMGHPAPTRRLDDGLREFLEMGANKIAQMLR